MAVQCIMTLCFLAVVRRIRIGTASVSPAHAAGKMGPLPLNMSSLMLSDFIRFCGLSADADRHLSRRHVAVTGESVPWHS